MRRIAQLFSLITLVSGFAFAGANTASAATTAFSCAPGFYQVIGDAPGAPGGQLSTLNPITGIYTPTSNKSAETYNAIGYNTADNFIYGIGTSGSIDDQLVQVSSDGSITALGVPTNLPASGASNYVTGDFDNAGNLWVAQTNATTFYKVNVSTKVATAVPLLASGNPTTAHGSEMVFVNGFMYLIQGTTLTKVDVSNGNVTIATVAGLTNAATSNFGAGWTDKNHDLFFSLNNDGSANAGTIYRITNYATTPNASVVIKGEKTTNNDGASCPLADSAFGTPVAVNDNYTTPENTTLTVTVPGILVNDSGTMITVTSHTGTSHGTLSAVNPDGSFTYVPNKDFIGVDTYDYTITDSLGQTAHATVTITIEGVQASNVTNTPASTDTLATTGSSSSLPMTIAAFLFMLAGFGLLRTAKRMQLVRIARRHK